MTATIVDLAVRGHLRVEEKPAEPQVKKPKKSWPLVELMGRTAAGTAVLTQTLGFETYLETAEAHQLRFEEGEDIFSRYLP